MRLRIGGQGFLYIRPQFRFRPFFRRLYLQGNSVAYIYPGGIAQGFINLEPVGPLAVGREHGPEAGTVDSPLYHRHTPGRQLRARVLRQQDKKFLADFLNPVGFI
jgi:hypothetical protein